MSETQNAINLEEMLNIDLSTVENQAFSGKHLICAFHQSTRTSKESLEQHDDVALKEYIIAYKEIIKFLEKLGGVFYFVITDISEKITILENYLTENPENYETISKLVKYEKHQKHLVPKREKPDNGARTILRLHRALLFIYRIINDLVSAQANSRSAEICVKAYDATLAQYHTWLVRKASRFGMNMMPNREVVLGYLSEDITEHEKFPVYIGKVLNVYNITQNIYERHEILDLP